MLLPRIYQVDKKALGELANLEYIVSLKHSRKQVRQGNNIVADGWAGASNPDPHPHPHPTHKNNKKLSRMLIFPLFYSVITDQGTDGQMKPHEQLRVRN